MNSQYDKYALWGISHWGKKRRQFLCHLRPQGIKLENVYSKDGSLIAVTKLKSGEWQILYTSYTGCTVQRNDDILYKFKEGETSTTKDLKTLKVCSSSLGAVEKIFKWCMKAIRRNSTSQSRHYRSNLRRQDAYTPYSDPRGSSTRTKEQEEQMMRIDDYTSQRWTSRYRSD
ncbi:hypothetical protein Tco_1474242 [Tanacetum coccineum]